MRLVFTVRELQLWIADRAHYVNYTKGNQPLHAEFGWIRVGFGCVSVGLWLVSFMGMPN
jgi:hypothetical protein